MRNDAAIIGAVEETFERQLPHRCVDDWHAGEASAPCLESRWVPTGPTSPFDVVGPRCLLGSGREDLEVKVTPTQLPAGTAAAGRPSIAVTGAGRDSRSASPAKSPEFVGPARLSLCSP